MNKTTRMAVIVGTGAALTLVASPARAEIVLGDSIRHVEIGMNKQQVIDVVGKPPKSVQRGTNDFGKFKVLKFSGKLQVNLQQFRGVVAVTTRNPNQRTDENIGVDSTKQQVRVAYPAVDCDSLQGGGSICTLGDLLPGERVTDFRVSNRLVRSVTVGVVVD